MGHRFSKTAALRQTNENKRKSLPAQLTKDYQNTGSSTAATYNRHSLPATVSSTSRVLVDPSGTQSPATLNLKFSSAAESPSRRNYTTSCSSNSSSSSSTGARQIIIKIQLAKMENGNGGIEVSGGADSATTTTIRLSELQPAAVAQQTTTAALVHQQQYQQTQSDYRNSNTGSRTAGSSSSPGSRSSPPPTLPAADQLVFQHINAIQIEAASPHVENDNDLVEYCEVLEQDEQPDADDSQQSSSRLCAHLVQSYLCEANNNSQVVSPSSKCCSQRKARSASTSTAASSTATQALLSSGSQVAAASSASRRRCCKCTCRDALRRLMEPKAYKSKSKAAAALAAQQHSTQQPHSSEPQTQWRPPTETPAMPGMPTPYPTIPASLRNLPTLPATATSGGVPAEGGAAIVATSAAELTATGSAGLSIWASNPHNRQFLVVSCPSTSVLTVGHLNDHSIRLTATSGEENFAVTESHQNQNPNSINQQQQQVQNSSTPAPSSGGPIVHSQVDYMHCLVPDLERITNSSFYWGKMDRYEAERLLEGKPEGTFLLRDSAQEEFLFSVTFRKYGRSLHARIEQSGHKFSFDCHDPSVYTASTVTGLLEHYKDPSCVMFFEPMLTIPLHRKTTFSLQKLCRATIVSNITYDGINELELPLRLKAYLKEYHYKQKLRVKPLDDPLYSCT